MNDPKTLVFVCLHGMGMSRLAAAYFKGVAPPGWRAVSAGLEPGATLSPTAARLLAGTSAEAFLERESPRGLGDVDHPQRVIAIRNPQIRFEVPGSEEWDLRNSEFAEPLRDEIRERAEALARSL
jgi:arsenate reductase (thioredoxin)